MDSNPIHHTSPAKNMKCSFTDFVQLLMISWAGQWTQTPSANPLQPKKWNAHFSITINFWFRPDWSMDSHPIHHPSPTNKMKCLILDYAQLLMIGWAGWWTQTPSTTPLQSKNEILIFGLCSTADVYPGCSMNSNPICHPSPAKKMKCSFLDFVELLMISQAGQWTQTPSATRLQPIKWNAHFWIMFNFWWLAGLVDGLEPHPPPLSSQKMKCFFFGLRSTSDDWPGWSMDSNPICHPSPAKKWNVHFWIMFNFWWLAGLVNGLERKWNACFWIMFTSDDLPGWLMNLNPICHPSSTKKMKCSIFDYVQLLMISQADQWTQTPSATPLQPKKWNAPFLDSIQLLMIGRAEWWTQTPSTIPLQSKKWNAQFGLHSTFDDWPGWSMDSNPIHHPSAANKTKSSFLYYVELLIISRAGWWTQTPSANPLQPKNEMFIFGLCSTSDDWPGWSMDSIKNEMLVFGLCSLLMICLADWWTRTSSANPLQPIKWNAHFWILFNFWWSARLVNGLKPHPPRLSSQKHEMLIYGFCSTSDDQPGWSMDLNPICHPSSAKKVKCSFLYYNQLLI